MQASVNNPNNPNSPNRLTNPSSPNSPTNPNNANHPYNPNVPNNQVAVKRLETFLSRECEAHLRIQHELAPHETPRVELTNATFSWGGGGGGDDGDGEVVSANPGGGNGDCGSGTHDGLENVTCCFEAGHSYALVGPVGSGKSTLVQSILGETNLVSGHSVVRGT